jgi:hypothetical protein
MDVIFQRATGGLVRVTQTVTGTCTCTCACAGTGVRPRFFLFLKGPVRTVFLSCQTGRGSPATMPKDDELPPPPDQPPPSAPPSPPAPSQGFPTGPPPQESSASKSFFGLSRCQIIGLAVAFVCVAVVAGGVFFRTEIQGCGCPEHYTSFHKQRLQLDLKGFKPGSSSRRNNGHDGHDDSCLCTGDIFSCQWDCGDGQMRGPNSWVSNAVDSPHDSPGADDVLCPGKPDAEYCDCDADCSSSVKFCECGEAKAIACCGTSRAERKANATATKNRKHAAPDKKIVDNKVVAAPHNKSKAHQARDLKQSQHHDESLKDDSKSTDTGANSHPGGVAPNPRSAAPSTMAPNTMAPNTMAPNTMAPSTMSPGADEATSLARQRKHGGGRNMALLPLLWSHGGGAGPDPDEKQKGQPNTRW